MVTPVITGRMIVAVAVTVEMGSEYARILYSTMLRKTINTRTERKNGIRKDDGPARDKESHQELR